MKEINNNTIREERKHDVVDCFFESLRELRKTKPYVTQEEVIHHAASREAPRFYVTFENARRFVSMLMRKKKLPFFIKPCIVNNTKTTNLLKESLKHLKTWE